MKLTKNLSKVELKRSKDSVTGKMGLSWVVHSLEHYGFKKMVEDEYGLKKKSNREISAYKKIVVGIITMLAGGQRVEDVEVIRKDKGLLESLGWDEMNCSDTQLNFMSEVRNNARNRRINNGLVEKAMMMSETKELTYDNDTTYIDSEKDSAEYSYQKKKQFSAMMGYIPEIGMINTVNYRAGNESPQVGIYNQLRKTCAQARRVGREIKIFRSDSAAHQIEIFTYCDINEIKYYISLDKNEAIKKLIKKLKAYEWKTMYGKYKEQYDTQWASAEYVVEKGFKVRVLILRWKNPDPTLFDESPYCYHVIGSNNREIDPMDWLEVHNGRMGTIEHCNEEIKSGYGCNYSPSHQFEKNRGYFLLGVLAYNAAQVMKLFYLGKETINWKIKTLRYRFIYVCGKIVKSGRRFCCKIINVTDEMFGLFKNCHLRLQT